MARPKSSHVRRRRETKEKLIAYRGKLVTVQEPLGEAPNGSGFVITLGAAPGLDATNLVVGRVVGGMELVRERFAALRSLRARQDPRPVTPVVSCAEILMWTVLRIGMLCPPPRAILLSLADAMEGRLSVAPAARHAWR